WKPAAGNLAAVMLQISQIEKPICSATIDQIRFRRAMNLPFDSQNDESSGFQSEIQLLIACPFIVENSLRLIPANPFPLWATKNARPRRTPPLRFPWNSRVAVNPSLDQGRRPQRTLRPLPIQALCQRAILIKVEYYQIFMI